MPPIPTKHYHLIREAEHEVSRLQALNLAYLLGGGRNCGHHPCRAGSFLQDGDGGDCSWLQLVICDILGVPMKSPIGWTGTLAFEGEPGRGRMFTIHIKDPFQTEGHTIGQFHHPDRDRWCECGGRDNPQPGDGVTWFTPTPERIAEFTVQRHFHGF